MDGLLDTFKALGDRNRLRVVTALLKHDELCACQLTEFLGVSGATASKHFGILVSAGLLDCRKEGRWVYYRVLEREKGLKSILDLVAESSEKSDEIKKDLRRLKKIMAIAPEELCRKQRGAKRSSEYGGDYT